MAGKTIGVLGLTFKGQTDDMRDSPSLAILPLLIKAGAQVQAFDPSDPHEAPMLLPEVKLVKTPEAAAENADVLVVLTDWMVFKSYELKDLATKMRHRKLVDLRNLFNERAVMEAGFESYLSLGTRPFHDPRRAEPRGEFPSA